MYLNSIWYIRVYKQCSLSTFDITILIPYMDGTFDSSYNPITIKEEIIRQFGADFTKIGESLRIARSKISRNLLSMCEMT